MSISYYTLPASINDDIEVVICSGKWAGIQEETEIQLQSQKKKMFILNNSVS